MIHGPKIPLLEIRIATLSDAEAVTAAFIRSVKEVGHSYYSPELTANWLTEFTVEESRRLISSADYYVVVACQGKDIVGIGTLYIPDHKVEHCYVTGGVARTGVGSKLLAELERKAVSLGMVEVKLECSEGTQIFYEGNSYRRDGEPTMFRNLFIVYPYSKKLG